jgi:hypothetical protein
MEFFCNLISLLDARAGYVEPFIIFGAPAVIFFTVLVLQLAESVKNSIP